MGTGRLKGVQKGVDETHRDALELAPYIIYYVASLGGRPVTLGD